MFKYFIMSQVSRWTNGFFIHPPNPLISYFARNHEFFKSVEFWNRMEKFKNTNIHPSMYQSSIYLFCTRQGRIYFFDEDEEEEEKTKRNEAEKSVPNVKLNIVYQRDNIEGSMIFDFMPVLDYALTEKAIEELVKIEIVINTKSRHFKKLGYLTRKLDEIKGLKGNNEKELWADIYETLHEVKIKKNNSYFYFLCGGGGG
jgi:hypothetical protein